MVFAAFLLLFVTFCCLLVFVPCYILVTFCYILILFCHFSLLSSTFMPLFLTFSSLQTFPLQPWDSRPTFSLFFSRSPASPAGSPTGTSRLKAPPRSGARVRSTSARRSAATFPKSTASPLSRRRRRVECRRAARVWPRTRGPTCRVEE